MRARGKGWFLLLLGFAAIALFVGLLHQGSLHMGGTTGRMIQENRQKDLEVYSYVYSEVGDLEEFLDDERGRYGRSALVEALGGARDEEL